MHAVANLAISPSARRRGLAKSLCEAGEQAVKTWGCTELLLLVEDKNQPARKLYRSLMHTYVHMDIERGRAVLHLCVHNNSAEVRFAEEKHEFSFYVSRRHILCLHNSYMQIYTHMFTRPWFFFVCMWVCDENVKPGTPVPYHIHIHTHIDFLACLLTHVYV